MSRYRPPQIVQAYTAEGELLHVERVETLDPRPELFCPECGHEVIPRYGEKQPHFAHLLENTTCLERRIAAQRSERERQRVADMLKYSQPRAERPPPRPPPAIAERFVYLFEVYFHRERRCGLYLALFEPTPAPRLTVHAFPISGDPLGVHEFVIADRTDWPEGLRELKHASRMLKSWLEQGLTGIVGGADFYIHPPRRVSGQGELSLLYDQFPQQPGRKGFTYRP